VREETFAWLKTQDLAVFPFHAGMAARAPTPWSSPRPTPDSSPRARDAARDPQSRGIPENFAPRAVIYVAPPFRHTHFEGRQVVVHNRLESAHELFSYNLYPGPSAKKGIYGVLLNIGEAEQWVTMHCSTVQVITPYDNKIVISHEGASGGGKSECSNTPTASRRLAADRPQLVTGDKRHLTLPRPATCARSPTTWPVPSHARKRPRQTQPVDAEDAWFVRINHIESYGIDPHLEKLTIHPPEPLLFLNVQGQPGATSLIWEHTEDEPGQPCPNPRVIIPATSCRTWSKGGGRGHPQHGRAHSALHRGSRPTASSACSTCCRRRSPGCGGWSPRAAMPTRASSPPKACPPKASAPTGPSPPAAASITPTCCSTRSSKPRVRYILTPNQHIGAWEVGFMPQWITREYLARRGGARFTEKQMKPSRCPLARLHPDARSSWRAAPSASGSSKWTSNRKSAPPPMTAARKSSTSSSIRNCHNSWCPTCCPPAAKSSSAASPAARSRTTKTCSACPLWKPLMIPWKASTRPRPRTQTGLR
jgi:hypothetical protein